jgi:ABC-type sugar transport system ATPase subunit
MTSSDVTEIVDVCDRIIIFYRGKVCAEFARGQVTKQTVMGVMMQGPVAERVL